MSTIFYATDIQCTDGEWFIRTALTEYKAYMTIDC